MTKEMSVSIQYYLYTSPLNSQFSDPHVKIKTFSFMTQANTKQQKLMLTIFLQKEVK